MATYQNPILPGFYPDPSVCRVGEDYYLVTSSFEYFPGVPVFHSRDLIHWRQLGHALDRPSQLNLDGILPSKAIWAPTIRYHQGTFYMITTFVDNQGEQHNFYVTAQDPAGPWSDPVWLEGAPGIDPSLLFDDDGKVYYTGNRVPPEGQIHAKNMDIWISELDVATGKLIGEKKSLWQGALKVAHAQESPHLYKIGDYYYLMIAEGGTGFTHAVTIARSEHVYGPYEGYKGNPILTHRHLGREAAIVNVGHADIFDTQDGDWWMVCLASRPYGGYYRNLGRETFLVPVKWEEGWPVVNPGKGIVEAVMPAPKLPAHPFPAVSGFDPFDGERLADTWNFLRTPRGDFWSLNERPGYLRLRLKPETLADYANPAFVCRRQQHMSFSARTVMEFAPQAEGEAAGMALLQNAHYQFRMVYGMFSGERSLRLMERRGGEDKLLASVSFDANRLFLKVEAREQAYSFYYSLDGAEWLTLFTDADGTILSTDVAGGFVGAYMGLYATSHGQSNSNAADFDWFEYLPVTE
jgi:xylan 1,4-beta-xylosidase